MENVSMIVRKIIGRDVPLSYPNFSGRNMIQTYARKMQLVKVISGKVISIAFLLTQVNPG